MLTFILLTIATANEALAGCTFNVESSKSPLLTDANFNSPIHHGHMVTFEENEQFYLKCLYGTYSPHVGEDGDPATCRNGSYLHVPRSGEILNYELVYCSYVDNKVGSTIQKTGASCGISGTEIEVGYEIFFDNFTRAYTACFDEDLIAPLYIQYDFTDLTGSSYENVTVSYFDSGRLVGTNITTLCINQKEIFEELGVVQPDGFKLVAGQILPHYYLAYPFDKYASQDYANVVPVWDSIQELWLDLLEDTLTQCATESEYSFYGGTSGVASLITGEGESVDIYLHNGTIPVPRWLWYRSCDGTVFYVFNNPTVAIAEVMDELGEICSNVGTISDNYAVCQDETF